MCITENIKKFLADRNILNWNFTTTGKNPAKAVAGVVKTFADLGLEVSNEDMIKLRKESHLAEFYNVSGKLLKESKGANVRHVVFYRDFPDIPEDVVSRYLYAIVHYITGLLPEDYNSEMEGKLRLPLYESVKCERLQILSDLEVKKYLIDYLNSKLRGKTSWSETDKTIIKDIIETYDVDITAIPENKENLAFIAGLLSVDKLSNVFKTATDVLRYIVSVCDGDITLTTNTKFRKLTRSFRRRVLAVINKLPDYAIEDFKKYREEWLRAAEVLHPGEYTGRFPRAAKFFKTLRNTKIDTFMTTVDKLMREKNIDELVKVLSARPGEFARKVDFLLRNAADPEVVISAFEAVMSNVSLSVLLQLYSHLYRRVEPAAKRTFVLKGVNSKVKSIDNNLDTLDLETVETITAKLKENILERISEKNIFNPEDKVYVKQSMFDIRLPDNSQRGASGGRHTLTKGSAISLESESGKNVLRFFTHWKNIQGPYGRVDIDLSLLAFNNDGTMEEISWRTLGGRNSAITYSGDITNAPDGASEFIDVDLGKLSKSIRYFVVCNNVFTGQKYCDIPECFAGVMLRKEAGVGEIFEPATVKCKADLMTSSTNQMIAFAYDVETHKLIWIDAPFDAIRQVSATAGHSVYNYIERVLTTKTISVGEIYEYCARKQGVLVENYEDATVVVGEHITPFDIEKFSELL